MRHPLIKEGGFKLRRYQESIVADAISSPSLVVLPTGLGKTIIAAMVAAHRLKEIPGSKVLFLAPTKPLAVQHQKSLEQVLDIGKTCVLTGAVPPKQRMKMWEDSSIIYATPQTVENDIIRGVDICDVSLVIFDEAHRAVGDYSYVAIAGEYLGRAKDPYTLGLTASPSSERDKIKKICENLGLKSISSKADTDRDVRPYVQKVKVVWEEVELPESFENVRKSLGSAYKRRLARLFEMGYLISDRADRIGKGVLLKAQAAIRNEISHGKVSFEAASQVAAAIKVCHAIELLETQGIRALDRYLKSMKSQKSRAVKALFKDNDMIMAFEGVSKLKKEGVEHPKLERIAKVASVYKGKKTLIFTQYRDSVDAIIERLNAYDLTAREFIGQASKSGRRGMTQKDQLNALESFRMGKYDALVATSVAEEGLDIPRVDAVIFYEPVPSEIRTIQRRGRTARTHAGSVHVLMAKGTRDQAYYWSSFHKEKRMGAVMSRMKDGGLDGLSARPAQASLESFHSNDRIRIVMDARERNSTIVSALRREAELDISNLEVGDFIVSDRVCIERKTEADFLQSIIDGRLMQQLSQMKREFEIPTLVLEGWNGLCATSIHPNSVRGALAAAALELGIRIIPSYDATDTAGLVIAMARREQLDLSRPLAIRVGKRPQDMNHMQRYIIESLPNVSAVLANRLLENFGSVEGVFCAEMKDMMKIEGIGEKKAKKIRQVIETAFQG